MYHSMDNIYKGNQREYIWDSQNDTKKRKKDVEWTNENNSNSDEMWDA